MNLFVSQYEKVKNFEQIRRCFGYVTNTSGCEIADNIGRGNGINTLRDKNRKFEVFHQKWIYYNNIVADLCNHFLKLL